VIVPPRTVPKTSSGKLRRTAARDLYERGAIDGRGRGLWLQLTSLALEGGLNRARRTARRAAELVYAGYWWAILGGLGALVWPLVLVLPKRCWRQALVRGAARSMLRLTGIPPAIKGASALPAGGVMIVSNHASYLD